MTAANYGIILSGHFNAKILTPLPWDRGRVSCKYFKFYFENVNVFMFFNFESFN